MESEIVKALANNLGSLTGATIAIAGAIILVIGLAKGKIYLSAQLEPILTTCKDNTEALKVANTELARVNILLAKAEVERELVWKQRAATVAVSPPEAGQP